jgi:hypothetical protein
MSKKLLYVLAIAAGSMLTVQVQAAPIAIDATTTITPDAADCPVLDNNVKIQLSDGVIAAYNCTNTSFQAGACHEQGTNKEQTVDCTYQEVDDGDGNLTYPSNSAGCPTWDGAGTAPTATDTFSGRVGFSGASGGGTVSQANLEATTCATGTVTNLVD